MGNKYVKLNNLELLNNQIEVIQYHKERITYLSKLKDGRFASCSSDGFLNIYKNNSLELQLSIKLHSNWINSFTQLINGKIMTCSGDKTIKITKLINKKKYEIEQTLIGHTEDVLKAIEIKKNELLSISRDKLMKIWIINDKKNYINILNIIFQYSNFSLCNILKLNDKEFVTSSNHEECIRFWNFNNYSYITTINNILSFSYYFQNMCLLEDDLLCITGIMSKGFYLIKISLHQIIKNIISPYNIISIIKSLNNIFLCSFFNEFGKFIIVKYKYEKETFKIIFEKEKGNTHFSIVELDNGKIAYIGNNNLIQLLEE